MSLLRTMAGRTGMWLRRHPRLGRLALALLPDTAVTVHVPWLGPFRVRVRQHRSYWLRDPLVHEGFPLGALKALVVPGQVVYDVGANIGLYTRFLANLLGAAKVLAFEPMQDNLAQLVANIELGGIADRVTVLPYALAHLDGEQELQVDDMSSASAALSLVTGGKAAEGRRQYGLPPKSELVQCRRLDGLIEGLGLPPPDLIKVDIEGAETLFLRGAMETLRTYSPRLLIETHGAAIARQVFDTLTDLGYHCAAKVSERIDPAGYCILTPAKMEMAQDLYDVHFLLAARDAHDLPDRIEEHRSVPNGRNPEVAVAQSN
jgi:FkbM family methyltransferase